MVAEHFLVFFFATKLVLGFVTFDFVCEALGLIINVDYRTSLIAPCSDIKDIIWRHVIE